MDNGTSAAVIAQFDRIAALPAQGSRDGGLRSEIVARAGRRRRALELGCGTGELSRELALRCSSVVGVDVSPGMLEAARRRNWGLNVEYLEVDAEEYLRARTGEFDLIVSVAAFHHMDERSMLGLCAGALSPGGLLIVADLYEGGTALDRLAGALSAAISPFERLARGAGLRPSREEREAWSAHRPDDHYLTLREARRIAQETLGDFTLERRLFGRYLLAYERPRAKVPAARRARPA